MVRNTTLQNAHKTKAILKMAKIIKDGAETKGQKKKKVFATDVAKTQKSSLVFPVRLTLSPWWEVAMF